MTSEEIKKAHPSENAAASWEFHQAFWLKEIAYQLAVMNEHRSDHLFIVNDTGAGLP